MSRKPKFKPVVTRVKLNPEQAVLACPCWSANVVGSAATKTATLTVCIANTRTDEIRCKTVASAAIS